MPGSRYKDPTPEGAWRGLPLPSAPQCPTHICWLQIPRPLHFILLTSSSCGPNPHSLAQGRPVVRPPREGLASETPPRLLGIPLPLQVSKPQAVRV